jgi:hypothetical protein
MGMKKISLADVQRVLTPQTVKSFQVIYFGIVSGATFLMGMILYLHFSGGEPQIASESSVAMVNRLTVMHFALLVVLLFLSRYIPAFFVSERRIGSMMESLGSADNADVAASLVAVMRTAKIMEIAVIEGPAFFGMVICLMAVTNQVMAGHPLYWINSVSYLVLVYRIYTDFPTRERVLEAFRSRFHYLLD